MVQITWLEEKPSRAVVLGRNFLPLVSPLPPPSFSLVQIRGLAPPPSRRCWEKAGGEAGLGPAEQTSGERVSTCSR